MLEKIISIITEQLNLEGTEINEDTSLRDDLGADSLDLFEVVMAFEEEFGIEISQESLDEIDTVGDVLEYIKKNGIE
ncbi:MAG: acyl carrier protein [Lachnospiraceae bacterium]|nr:acyl carrier protein [Lachnospiraceae bacterium]